VKERITNVHTSTQINTKDTLQKPPTLKKQVLQVGVLAESKWLEGKVNAEMLQAR
jgi:hypothetical protein